MKFGSFTENIEQIYSPLRIHASNTISLTIRILKREDPILIINCNEAIINPPILRLTKQQHLLRIDIFSKNSNGNRDKVCKNQRLRTKNG